MSGKYFENSTGEPDVRIETGAETFARNKYKMRYSEVLPLVEMATKCVYAIARLTSQDSNTRVTAALTWSGRKRTKQHCLTTFGSFPVNVLEQHDSVCTHNPCPGNVLSMHSVDTDPRTKDKVCAEIGVVSYVGRRLKSLPECSLCLIWLPPKPAPDVVEAVRVAVVQVMQYFDRCLGELAAKSANKSVLQVAQDFSRTRAGRLKQWLTEDEFKAIEHVNRGRLSATTETNSSTAPGLPANGTSTNNVVAGRWNSAAAAATATLVSAPEPRLGSHGNDDRACPETLEVIPLGGRGQMSVLSDFHTQLRKEFSESERPWSTEAIKLLDDTLSTLKEQQRESIALTRPSPTNGSTQRAARGPKRRRSGSFVVDNGHSRTHTRQHCRPTTLEPISPDTSKRIFQLFGPRGLLDHVFQMLSWQEIVRATALSRAFRRECSVPLNLQGARLSISQLKASHSRGVVAPHAHVMRSIAARQGGARTAPRRFVYLGAVKLVGQVKACDLDWRLLEAFSTILGLDLSHCINDDVFALIVSGCRSLQTLDMSRSTAGGKRLHVGDAAIETIGPRTPDLVKLSLSGCHLITDASLSAVAKHWPKLETLNVRYCGNLTDGAVSAVASSCESLTSLDLGCCDHLTDAAIIAVARHCPNLKSLQFGGCGRLTDDAIVAVATGCPKMNYLALGRCQHLTDVAILAVANHLQNLEVLILSGCSGLTDAAFMAIGSCCHQLSSLALCSCHNVTDAAIATIACGCPLLKSLSLRSCRMLTNAAITAIATFCRGLVSLILSGCDNLTGYAIYAVANGCLGLTSLNLGSCHSLTDAAIIALGHNCHQLTSLYLGGCPHVTDLAVAAVGRGCKKLKSLGLRACTQLTDAIIETIDSTHITTLDLGRCHRFTDRSLEAIARKWPMLSSLNLSHCSGITSAGVSAVAQSCTALSSLSLRFCTGVDTQAAASLAQHCSGLMLLDMGGCAISSAAIPHICALKTLQTLALQNCPGISTAAAAFLTQKLRLCTISL